MMREQGFTLIELLAALVAGSLLLVSLSWSLSGLVRELPRSDAPAATRLAASAPALVTLIEAARPPAPGEPVVAEAARFSAVVPPPAAAGASGPLRLTLGVAGGTDGKALIAELRPLDPRVAWPLAARRHVVAEGFDGIDFDYLHGADDSDRAALPRLVTIRFRSGGDLRRISARPRADSDGSCRFDPISMACRI